MEPDPFDLPDPPTVEQYKKAFLACKAALKSANGQSLPLDMLRAHYAAPDHTLTAGELAEAPTVQLANFRAANLAYGRYAKALCKHLGKTPKILISILVRFQGGKPDDEFVKWTLLPSVVAALEELHWVKAT